MKKLIMASITAVVVIVVLAGTLIPILDDATATSDTFTNDGYFYVDKISSSDADEITIHWDNTNPKEFIINDVTVDVTSWPATGYTIVTDGASWLIRMGTSSAVALQLMGYNFTGGGSTTKSLDITISGGTVSATQVSTEDVTYNKSTTYTDLWVYSPTPTDYVMKKADKVAYLNEDSEYLAMGVTQVTQWNTVIKVSGTISSFTAEIVYPPNVTTTVTNPQVVSSENDDHIDLYELEKVTFTISDGTSTVNAIYSYFIVPAEVTAERTVHFTDGENAIFNAIPVMIIIALLLGVVALVLRSRMD